MKISLIGAGAVGSIFGSLLAKGGQDVTLIGINPERIALLNEKGIKVNGVSGEFSVSVKAVTDVSSIDVADLVLVCVKAYDTKKALSQHNKHIGPETIILTLQNGLGNVEQIAKVCGHENVLGGTTAQGGYLLETGHLRHAGNGITHIGELSGKVTSRIEHVANIFNSAGIKTEISKNVDALIWAKIIVNVGINALTALLRVNNGKTASLSYARAIQEEAVNESLAVAKQAGIELDEKEIAARVVEVAKVTEKNVSSMLNDVLKNQRTEIDFINGAICNLGKKYSVATPVNQTLTNLIKATEQAYGMTVS